MSLEYEHHFKGRSLSSFEENLQQPRHRWYPFKEGFSNQLVREAISHSSFNRKRPLRILDPFSGSGTTALTSALMGHDTVSVEINPFCVFTSKVKCTRGGWREQDFRKVVKEIAREGIGSDSPAPLEKLSTFSESNGNSKWLFNRDVIRATSATIASITRRGGRYSSALRLAAIRSAMLCCNAKQDGKCLRYYKDWRARQYSQKNFFSAFFSMTDLMLQDTKLAPVSRQRQAKIIRGDARVELRKLEDRSLDLMITSPPYLNSFDYSDVYRPELFLGEFVSSNEELRKIRLKTIRSHVQVKWDSETDIQNDLLKGVIDAINESGGLWSKRLPNMVEAYFDDMRKVLSSASRLLRKGAEAWIVVGTSAYNRCHVPVDLILADLGNELGFTLKGVYVLRQLRSSGQQWTRFGTQQPPLRESLIILKR